MQRDQCQHQYLTPKLRLPLRREIELDQVLHAHGKPMVRIRYQDGKSKKTKLPLYNTL